MIRTAQTQKRRGVVAVEAAIVLPVLIIVMFGTWEVGRLIQVNQIVTNAAREGARFAAGGYVNGTPITSSMVQQAVRDYIKASDPSGRLTAAANGATVALVCNASPTWVNPSDALPLDRFQLQVTIPAGAAFNSMAWSLATRFTGVSTMSVTVNWMSLNDLKISVDAQLPY